MRQWTVDAFAAQPFAGNGACVVEPFEQWPEAGWMQSLAAENNQAETAYLCRAAEPGAFGLRWFTPACEVTLCGHATLAAAHVLFDELAFAGAALRFATQSGVLTVTRAPPGYAMDFPATPPRRRPMRGHDPGWAGGGARPRRGVLRYNVAVRGPCILSSFVIGAMLIAGAADAGPLRIVAAEAVYAGLAREIGGADAAVIAVLDNPAQDPHLFEAGPAIARALSEADIVIYNGAGYDPWMRPLLTATGGGGVRAVIDVADLLHAGAGGNPHLWYNPAAMPVLATAIAAALVAADPAHADGFRQRLAGVRAELAGLGGSIATLRARHAGAAVTATEPVFGPMLDALGLVDRNPAFQRAVMNGTEPAASDIAAIEADLRDHRVRALIHNAQTDDSGTRRLLGIARAAGVPIVAISETEPAGTHYADWVGGELAALDRALGPR